MDTYQLGAKPSFLDRLRSVGRLSAWFVVAAVGAGCYFAGAKFAIAPLHTTGIFISCGWAVVTLFLVGLLWSSYLHQVQKLEISKSALIAGFQVLLYVIAAVFALTKSPKRYQTEIWAVVLPLAANALITLVTTLWQIKSQVFMWNKVTIWLISLGFIGLSSFARVYAPLQRALEPKPVQCATLSDYKDLTPFFSPFGTKYWYRIASDGRVELFDRSGPNPETGGDLEEVDESTVTRLRQQVDRDDKLFEDRQAELLRLKSRADDRLAGEPSVDLSLAPVNGPEFTDAMRKARAALATFLGEHDPRKSMRYYSAAVAQFTQVQRFLELALSESRAQRLRSERTTEIDGLLNKLDSDFSPDLQSFAPVNFTKFTEAQAQAKSAAKAFSGCRDRQESDSLFADARIRAEKALGYQQACLAEKKVNDDLFGKYGTEINRVKEELKLKVTNAGPIDFETLAPMSWPKFKAERETAEAAEKTFSQRLHPGRCSEESELTVKTYQTASETFGAALSEANRHRWELNIQELGHQLSTQRSALLPDTPFYAPGNWPKFVAATESAVAAVKTFDAAMTDKERDESHTLAVARHQTALETLAACATEARTNKEMVGHCKIALDDRDAKLKKLCSTVGVADIVTLARENGPKFLDAMKQAGAAAQSFANACDMKRCENCGGCEGSYAAAIKCYQTADDLGAAALVERDATLHRIEMTKRYLGGTNWKESEPSRRIAVLIATADQIDEDLTALMVKASHDCGYYASGSFLTPAFVTDHLLKNLVDGKQVELGELGLGAQCKYLLVGIGSVTPGVRHPAVPDRFVSDATIEIRLISADTAKRLDGFSVGGHGAGWNAKSAETDARQEMIKKLLAQTNEWLEKRDGK